MVILLLLVLSFTPLRYSDLPAHEIEYRAQIAWGLSSENLVWKDIPIQRATWRHYLPKPHSYTLFYIEPTHPDVRCQYYSSVWNGSLPFSTSEVPRTAILEVKLTEMEETFPHIGIFRMRFQAKVDSILYDWELSPLQVILDTTHLMEPGVPLTK